MAGGPFAGSGTGEGNEDVGVEAVVEEGERVEAVPLPPQASWFWGPPSWL